MRQCGRDYFLTPGLAVVLVLHCGVHATARAPSWCMRRHAVPNWERRGVVSLPQAPWCGTDDANETTNHLRQKFDGLPGDPRLGSLRVVFFLPQNRVHFL